MDKNIIREYRKINNEIIELIDVASNIDNLDEFKTLYSIIKDKKFKRNIIIDKINKMRL